ncbi:MAG: hypothetical protein IJU76_14715, partial [Desulfovibrionaceae bacterium]|nr:hypothetical protein [Desulfovibrionaceae bacterium]
SVKKPGIMVVFDGVNFAIAGIVPLKAEGKWQTSALCRDNEDRWTTLMSRRKFRSVLTALKAPSDFCFLCWEWCWERKKGLQEIPCKPLMYLASPTGFEPVLAA